jgi:hypothetical protein
MLAAFPTVLFTQGAWAQEDPGLALADQLLDASVSGAGPAQVAALTELSTRVAATDAAGPAVWYWLANTQAQLGQLEAARSTLLEGIRTGACPDCQDLFQELELERLAAGRPTTWTFDDPHHGLFLGSEGGSIRLGALEGRTLLEWAPEPGPDTADRVVFGVREGLASLTVEVRAVGAPGAFQVQVVDRAGRRYVSPDLVAVPADRFVTVTRDVKDFAPLATGVPLDPDDVRRVELVEWAAARPSAAGAPAFLFDALTLR